MCAATAVWGSETQTYVYDELGRLVTVGSSGTVNNNQRHSICYDSAGNRTQYKSNAANGGLTCPGASAPTILISNASTTEGGVLTFTVTRSGDSSAAASVSYTTAGGTATSGSDFAAKAGTLNFSAGQTTATIGVTTIDDTFGEAPESMSVMLSAATGGVTIFNATATGEIIDNNDGDPPTILITYASAGSTIEGNLLNFYIDRQGDTREAVSINYSSASGTATSGADFASVSGTVNFAPGQTSVTISVPSIDDSLIESEETMTVSVRGPSGGARIGVPTATATISDNDGPVLPTLSVSDAGSDEGLNMAFTVTLSAPSASVVTVNYGTAVGTADTSDYVTTSGTLTFQPGQTILNVTVMTNADAVAEFDEYFYLILSAPTNASIVNLGSGTITDPGGGGG